MWHLLFPWNPNSSPTSKYISDSPSSKQSTPSLSQQSHHVLPPLNKHHRFLSPPSSIIIPTVSSYTVYFIPTKFVVQSVIMMGGAVRESGNVTPCATANFVGDPEATSIVYKYGMKFLCFFCFWCWVWIGQEWGWCKLAWMCAEKLLGEKVYGSLSDFDDRWWWINNLDQELAQIAELKSPMTQLLIKASECIKRYTADTKVERPIFDCPFFFQVLPCKWSADTRCSSVERCSCSGLCCCSWNIRGKRIVSSKKIV